MSMRKIRSLTAKHTALAFMLGMAFIVVCYVGLPFDFSADHPLNIRSAEDLSYGELAKLIVNPFSLAWFYPPGTDLMAYVRPLQFIILKVFYSFSYELVPFHITAAIGHGLLLAFIFFIIHRYTRKYLWGWLGCVLYISFPSNAYLMLSDCSLDFQYFVSCLDLIAVLLMVSLSTQKKRFVIKLLSLFFLFGIMIKLKSTEKIFPIILLAFLVWRSKYIIGMIGKKRTCAILVMLLASFIYVIPVIGMFPGVEAKFKAHPKYSVSKDEGAMAFSVENMVKRTFFVSSNDIDWRVFTERSLNLYSFTGNFTHLFGLVLWVGIIIMALTRFRSKDQIKNHFFWIMFIWFCAVIVGFGSGTPLQASRMLNFAYVPAIILFLISLDTAERSLHFYKLYRVLMIVLFSVSIYSNFFIFAQILRHSGGLQYSLAKAESDVLSDLMRREFGSRELYDRHVEVKKRFLVFDWHDDIGGGKKDKIAFLFSRNEHPFYMDDLIETVAVYRFGAYSFLDAKPLAFRWFQLLAKIYPNSWGRNHTVYVFKIYRDKN